MFKFILLLTTITLGFAQELETVKPIEIVTVKPSEIVTVKPSEIETVKPSEIEGEEIITNLDLSNRNLEDLTNYNFSALKELESIDLSYNDLSYITDDQFRKNLKLKSINLAGNPRLQLNKFSSFFIANIENLNLSHCNIDSVYENSFDGLLNLKTIDLSYNPIKKHGISYHSLKSLMSLREITVSQADSESFTEICDEIDLTIFIKSESNNLEIKCEDVRAGKLDPIILEPETQKVTEAVLVVTESAVNPPIADENVTEEKAKEQRALDVTTKIEENNTIAPDVVPPQTISQEEKETEPKKDENGGTEELIPPQVPIENKEENGSAAPKTEMPLPTTGVSAPKNEVAKNNNEPSKNAKTMLEHGADQDGEAKVGKSESSSQPAAGTTVLVILVIAAVVAGLAAFGYKYYKSGQEDEVEPIEKELQEIAIDSKTNGAATTVENEPLIHQRKHSVEIKEVDETTEDQNKNKSSQNGSSYIPITSVEKMVDEDNDSVETPK